MQLTDLFICLILKWYVSFCFGLPFQRLNLNNTLHKNVCNRSRWRSWLANSSLDAPLERSASSRIIMKEFLFSIWFISLSSNLKLYIDIFIMSVSHVFTDFRFVFVQCSCSRREGTSLFSLFYKIILYIQGSRLRPKCDHFLRVCK